MIVNIYWLVMTENKLTHLNGVGQVQQYYFVKKKKKLW